MNICENIFTNAKLFADHTAIVFDERTLSYADVERLSSQAAKLLMDHGVERGDRVGILLPNVPAFAVWYYAVLRLGAVAVSISTRLTPEEVAFVINDCQARLLVTNEESNDSIRSNLPECVEHALAASDWADRIEGDSLDDCPRLDAISFVHVEPDEPAAILYTSGTTGFPKGATLSHQNVRATVHAFNHLCQMQHEDRLLLAVPLFHCYGQNALLNAGLNVGATIVIQRRFDLNESKQLIVGHEITKLFGVPTTFQLICDCFEPSDLHSVEYCFSAAATLPIQLSNRWQEKFGMPIYEGYGLTETSPFASYNHRDHFVPGSIGTPVDLVEMKVVDPGSGEVCPTGSLGEIAIRGPNVMLGYWNRPEETATAIRNGWFHSGDIGRVDEAGFFYIVDRVKDMIAVGGMKVFPAEVERVLLDHPSVAEAAVVGFPDPVFGEKVVAFIVVADSSFDSHKIQHHCQRHLASYKSPREIVHIEELPRNPTGKILKTRLRESDISGLRNWEESAPAGKPVEGESDRTTHGHRAPSNAAPPIVHKLRDVHPAGRQQAIASLILEELQEIVGQQDLPSAEQRLAETDLDSLMIIELCDRLQRQVGDLFKVPATLVFDHPRIIDLASFLFEKLAMPNDSESSAIDAVLDVAQDQSSNSARDNSAESQSQEAVDSGVLSREVETMSEQQAMQALLRELAD